MIDRKKIVACMCVLFMGISTVTYAADSELTLDTNNSSSSFAVKNSDGNSVFRAGGDGNVGIGTTSPGEKLEINGNLKVTGAMPMPRNEGVVVKYVSSDIVDIDASYLTVFDDSTGFGKVLSSIDLTVSIATSGVNGLDVGSETQEAWYYIWIIYNGSTAAGLLSLQYGTAYGDSVDPTMPAGYTFKKLVGAVKNESGNFIKFVQRMNRVSRANAGILSNVSNTSYVAKDMSVSMPTAISSRFWGYVKSRDNTNADSRMVISPDNDSAFRIILGVIRFSGMTEVWDYFEVDLHDGTNFYYRVTTSTNSVNTLLINGYYLNLF